MVRRSGPGRKREGSYLRKRMTSRPSATRKTTIKAVVCQSMPKPQRTFYSTNASAVTLGPSPYEATSSHQEGRWRATPETDKVIRKDIVSRRLAGSIGEDRAWRGCALEARAERASASIAFSRFVTAPRRMRSGKGYFYWLSVSQSLHNADTLDFPYCLPHGRYSYLRRRTSAD
jgi:hypothetical protein